MGNAYGDTHNQGLEGTTSRTTVAIVQIMVSSRAQILVMESPVGPAGTENWNNNLRPEIRLAGCEIVKASLSAKSVGVPTTKRRVFVVAAKKSGDDTLQAKLSKWKKNVKRLARATPTVGAF